MSRWTDTRRSLTLRHLAASSAPLLVGPWRSETGFEFLYWLPWLAAWVSRYHVAPERLYIITRGGAGACYGVPGLHTVELYDHVSVADIRQAGLEDFQRRGSVKQTLQVPWETQLLALVAAKLGLRRYYVLHPSLMYTDLEPWWAGRWGLEHVMSRIRFSDLGVPPVPLSLALPEKFVAMKFYARSTFPPDETLQGWVEQRIDQFLTRHPDVSVVDLESGIDADDHSPFRIEPHPRVVSIRSVCTPQNNLAVQAAVLARASGFIGTYGGTMQLAVRLKKPAVGFYSTWEGTCYAHKALTEYLGVLQQSTVLIGRPQDADFVAKVMG